MIDRPAPRIAPPVPSATAPPTTARAAPTAETQNRASRSVVPTFIRTIRPLPSLPLARKVVLAGPVFTIRLDTTTLDANQTARHRLCRRMRGAVRCWLMTDNRRSPTLGEVAADWPDEMA